MATNNNRADWAEEAIETFALATFHTGLRPKEECREDYETVLGDLLGDILHWCRRENVDFEACLESGRNHHDYESTQDWDEDD